MPDSGNRVLVTNTTPLIALTAATGGLEILRHLYARVVVPLEVAQEVRVGGAQAFGGTAEGLDHMRGQRG